MPNGFLVFDMDGVLVDVSESYRETIQQTVEHFTGKRITREDIQEWKNRGGWNDDWALSTAMIRDAGVDADYDAVVKHFQGIFHGDGSDGLILRERWIARDGLLERLNKAFRARGVHWTAALGSRVDAAPLCARSPLSSRLWAPATWRITSPRRMACCTSDFAGAGRKIWYIGDTVDDARSAKAAGVPFIGIATPASTRRDELVALLQAEGAVAVLEDINQLEDVLK